MIVVFRRSGDQAEQFRRRFAPEGRAHQQQQPLQRAAERAEAGGQRQQRRRDVRTLGQRRQKLRRSLLFGAHRARRDRDRERDAVERRQQVVEPFALIRGEVLEHRRRRRALPACPAGRSSRVR